MRNRKFMLVGLAMAGAAGCATLGRATFKEPIVHFQEAKITGVGITGGSLEVLLSVYNPNGFRLDGSRLTYNVLIDSIPFVVMADAGISQALTFDGHFQQAGFEALMAVDASETR